MTQTRIARSAARAALAAALCAALPCAHAQGTPDRIERFSAALRLQDQAMWQVDAETRLIANRQKASWPAGPAALLVEVRGGRLVVDLDGKRQQRKAGDFWVVSPGVAMTVETEDDSAALGITAIAGVKR